MSRSLLGIKIKRGKVWRLLTVAVLIVVFVGCGTSVTNLNQPATGTVGKPTQVSMTITYCSPESGTANLVVAVLMPVGWQGQKNMTMNWSCQAIGSGTLKPMPAATLEKQSGLPWAQALMNKFGLANNYNNNMQWVVFESDQYNMSSVSTPVTLTINFTPGADNNDAIVNMNYLIAETNDGLQDPGAFQGGCSGAWPYQYYELMQGLRYTLTGGAPNSNIDYADPQYGTVSPGAALIDDYITVSFNGNITPTPLLGSQQVYLHATAVATDSSKYPVIEQTQKTMMTETSSNSNIYKLTLWPRSYFSFPSTKTLDHIEYIFTDATGNTQVGFNNTSTLFTYKFQCQ